MARTVARLLAESLQAHDVDLIYCVPGESYLGLTDALSDMNSIRLAVCRHEAGAAFMAVADGRLRVEWNDLSISETAFAIYKRVIDKNGSISFELLGKETPAATLFERPIARNEVKEDDQVVVVAEPSSLPPANFVAAIVNRPLMLECNETKQTFKVVETPEL